MTGSITGAIEGAMLSPHCFIAGTIVLAGVGKVAIDTIQAGDYVWAWDEETGDVRLKLVVETYVNETDELTHVWVNGEEIITTPGHPFYSPVKGWTDAAKLRAGDILVLVNGEYVVVEKVQHELLESPVKVYNFQVEDYHTYYVSNSGVLVHNSCGNEYFKATRTKDSVKIGAKITDKQALNALRKGRDVFANSKSAAKSLAKRAFGGAKVYSEIHRDVANALPHFHNRAKHIFHVFYK